MSKPTVLIAEDESALVTLLRYNLEREGYTVIDETVPAEDSRIPISAHLTPRAIETLQLKVGDVVWLVLKTHSCHVMRS